MRSEHEEGTLGKERESLTRKREIPYSKIGGEDGAGIWWLEGNHQ